MATSSIRASISELPGHSDASFSFPGKCGPWDAPCVYTATPRMRSINAKAYEPRVVAIGPYHYGKEHLLPMEYHKRRALWHFVAVRSPAWRLDQIVDRFIDAGVLQLLRASYDAKLDPKWDDDRALACLAVLDGCFLLELVLNHWEGRGLCDDDDPIFGRSGDRRHAVLSLVKTDLLLIENQLPLWVVGRLAEIAGLSLDLNGLVRTFYGGDLPDGDQLPGEEPLGLHILDVYHKSRLSSGDYAGWTVPCGAQELCYNRVSIREAPRNGSLKAISFSLKPQNPILYIYRKLVFAADYVLSRVRLLRLLGCVPPVALLLWLLRLVWMALLHLTLPLWLLGAELVLPRVAIDESTEAVLLNLMAFEALHLGIKNLDMGVTCYALLLRSVLRSKEDVGLLRDAGVLTCVPDRRDKEVLELLSRVTREAVVGDGAAAENGRVAEMCAWRANRSLAWLRRNLAKNDFRWLRMLVSSSIAVYAICIMLFFALKRPQA